MALTVKAGFGHDLEELRADLDSVEVGLGKLVGSTAREKLSPLVAEVRGLLPFDPTHRGWPAGDIGERDPEDPGHIRDSVKGGSTQTGLTIYTTHPGAPWHWWGGTIRPKGIALTIAREVAPGTEFVSKTADDVVDSVDDALDDLMRRHGL